MTPPARTEAPPFRHAIRVYWEDTDAGGVVYYANYLKFFERARTEWLRAIGIDQQELREQSGGIFIVVEVRVRHRGPARLDDLIEITVAVKEPGPVRPLVFQQAFCDGRLVAEAEIRLVFCDARTLRPRRIPETFHFLLA